MKPEKTMSTEEMPTHEVEAVLGNAGDEERQIALGKVQGDMRDAFVERKNPGAFVVTDRRPAAIQEVRKRQDEIAETLREHGGWGVLVRAIDGSDTSVEIASW